MFKAIDKIKCYTINIELCQICLRVTCYHVCVGKCSVEAGDNKVELAKEAGPAGLPQGRSPSIVPHRLITINSYIWKF